MCTFVPALIRPTYRWDLYWVRSTSARPQDWPQSLWTNRRTPALKIQRNSLLAEQAALNSQIADASSTVAPADSAAQAELAQKKSRLAEVVAAIAQLPPAPTPGVSKNFLQDVLNGGDGISFHRFQIAIWTIVLGAVFVWAVYRYI